MQNTLSASALELYNWIDDQLSRINPIILVGGSIVGTLAVLRIKRLLRASDKRIDKRLAAYAFKCFRRLPAVRRQIEAKLESTRLKLQKSIHECDEQLEFITQLPTEAAPFDELTTKASAYAALNKKYEIREGHISGAVYTDPSDEGHLEVLTEIFRLYAFSNPLHPDVFPGCRKMEAEVVRMVANLFHAPPETACGTMTSGGTESLILVCLASRNLARSRGIDDPQLLVPTTAHAAFDKAAQLLGMRIHHVPVHSTTTMEVDLRAMERAINSSTCLLVGSAPNFPFGNVDNIPAIAALGQRYGIPVHVDACLGGLLLAFAEEAGFGEHLPLFDFRLVGVTSLSCDTHKYGYAPKGASVVVYRAPHYLHHQYFCVAEWPGGIYATPTLAGSRAGLNIALTWATLLYFGREEYVRRAGAILHWTRVLAEAIGGGAVEGVELVGRPDASVCAFTSTNCNIYAVSDKLNSLGWNLNTLQLPNSIHFCLTYNQARKEVIDAFISDLRKACEEVVQQSGGMSDGESASDTAAIYGMAAQIPDKSLISEMAYAYLDACYSTPTAHTCHS